MPLGQVRFDITNVHNQGVFKINLTWPADVSQVVLSAVGRGEIPPSGEEILKLRARHALSSINASEYIQSGSPVHDFAPEPMRFIGKWVDIYAYELDREDNIERLEPVTAFFGRCAVAYAVKYRKLSPDMRGAYIALRNKSRFPIPAYSIGYRVGRWEYEIPLPLGAGDEIRYLPQIEVPDDEDVIMTQLAGSMPVIYEQMR